jgi:hypothetical protein
MRRLALCRWPSPPLRKETQTSSETLCFLVIRIPDGGQCPEAQRFWPSNIFVSNSYFRHIYAFISFQVYLLISGRESSTCSSRLEDHFLVFSRGETVPFLVTFRPPGPIQLMRPLSFWIPIYLFIHPSNYPPTHLPTYLPVCFWY